MAPFTFQLLSSDLQRLLDRIESLENKIESLDNRIEFLENEPDSDSSYDSKPEEVIDLDNGEKIITFAMGGGELWDALRARFAIEGFSVNKGVEVIAKFYLKNSSNQP